MKKTSFKNWTKEEIIVLKQMVKANKSYTAISEVLSDRTPNAIKTKVSILKRKGAIASHTRVHKKWNANETNCLISLIQSGKNITDISKEMGRTYKSVWAKIRNLNKYGLELNTQPFNPEPTNDVQVVDSTPVADNNPNDVQVVDSTPVADNNPNDVQSVLEITNNNLFSVLSAIAEVSKNTSTKTRVIINQGEVSVEFNNA